MSRFNDITFNDINVKKITFEKGIDTQNIPPIHEQFSIPIFYYVKHVAILVFLLYF